LQLTKKDVVAIALARLGGAAQVIDTEDIAIVAHEIDQVAFGWKKYSDRADLDVVRVTLRHEGESKDPRVEGSIQNGWHLTPRGVAWIEANPDFLKDVRMSVAPASAATQSRRAETRERGAAVNRVLTSDAFRLWSQGRPFSPVQAAAVFRIDEYTPAKDRTKKAAQLQEMIRGDEVAEAFMKDAIPAALALTAPSGRQEGEK
jgi:hypothetical protein